MSRNHGQRRVVVTGIGAVASAGNNVKDLWYNIINGKSGVSQIDSFNVDDSPCKIASMVRNLNFEDYLPARQLSKMDKFMAFGLIAAQEAIRDSNWQPATQEDSDRTGVLIGSGIGGLGSIEQTAILHHAEHRKVSPFFIPASLINLLPGHLAIQYNFSGPNSAVSTACASGAHAIGDASRMIKYGDADVMIAGGAEAPITPIGLAGFAAARTLATNFNDRPAEASRPWDQEHAGFIMGEGAAILVLEEYEHALRRGAKIYAEVKGYGLTGDAYHITSPNGRGALRAMQNALSDAQIQYSEVNYINAHGTSTKVGDQIELDAVQNLFEPVSSLCMSSTKSSIGHLLGAAGSIEAILTILAIRDQIAPPTLNLHKPLDNTKINLVPLQAQQHQITYALSNSFGFGGTNASLVFGKI